MQDSNLLMYAVGEIAIVLLAVCIFLCFHVKSLKKLIVKLEEKVTSLRKSTSVARNETKTALQKLSEQENIKPKLFLDYLDEELAHTRQHHQSLSPDRDIVLDITPDAPIERQAASLRHAFLIAEKEARHAGDERQSSWDILQAKLQQIIQFYEGIAPAESEQQDSADTTQIDNCKKQIENLQRYKKLFFDTEEKWQTAKVQADEYYQQLMAKCKDWDDTGECEALLKSYSQAYGEIDSLITGHDKGDKVASSGGIEQVDNRERSIGKMAVANQEEIHRLKNMAVDQHKVIDELKHQLLNAQSPEEQQAAIDRLTEQLEQQQRFLKEAETCTQLIEDELTHTMSENEQLRSQLEGEGGHSGISEEGINNLESLVEGLTNASKDMLSTIATLEQDNESLKQQLKADAGDESDHQVEQLKEKLGEMQQELLNMQTQHIELEERYLELKMSGD